MIQQSLRSDTSASVDSPVRAAGRVARSRQRILFVQRPLGGGSATGLMDLLRVLDRDRYEPIVLFYEQNHYCEEMHALEAGVQVLTRLIPDADRWLSHRRAPKSRLRRLVRPWEQFARWEWPIAGKLSRLMRSWQVDLVHQNTSPSGDRISVLAAARAGIPQVCHVRFLPNYHWLIDPIAARRSRYFIYMSRAIEQHCRSALRVSDERGAVVYDTIDLERFAAAAAMREQIRADLGLSSEDWVVSNVGRLVRWKGQDYFLRAFAEVARAHSGARALLVGDSGRHPGDRVYESELHAQVRSLGLEKQVLFTGFRSDVAEVMAASDVVVHSSSDPEPFGRVIIEAMATGRPVIATAAGGPLEVIRDGENGSLVPIRSVEGMAAAMWRLIEEPEHASRLGRRAQEDVLARFTTQSFAAAIHSIYQRVIPAPPAIVP